jgi:hypothetical protein
MSQQGTKALAVIMKTEVAILIIVIIFYLPSVIGAPSQTTLAAVEIVCEPADCKQTNQEQPRHVSAHRKKINKQSKRKFEPSPGKTKISGYRGRTFVYGEAIQQKNGKFQGYIYHRNNRKTYVHGEKVKDRRNLDYYGKNVKDTTQLYDTNGVKIKEPIKFYDSKGNLYRMID